MLIIIRSVFNHVSTFQESRNLMMEREEMEQAIEGAAKYLKKKEEKQHKKHNPLNKKHSGPSKEKYEQLTTDEDCHCEIVKSEIEEGKKSRVIKSSIIDRTAQRRKGVAAQNDTEKKLVKETVEVLVKTQNMKDYNLI